MDLFKKHIGKLPPEVRSKVLFGQLSNHTKIRYKVTRGKRVRLCESSKGAAKELIDKGIAEAVAYLSYKESLWVKI